MLGNDHSSVQPSSMSAEAVKMDSTKMITLAPTRMPHPRYSWPTPVFLNQLLCSFSEPSSSFPFPFFVLEGRRSRRGTSFLRRGRSDRSSDKMEYIVSTTPKYGRLRTSTHVRSGGADPRVCTCSRRRTVSAGSVTVSPAQAPRTCEMPQRIGCVSSETERPKRRATARGPVSATSGVRVQWSRVGYRSCGWK